MIKLRERLSRQALENAQKDQQVKILQKEVDRFVREKQVKVKKNEILPICCG